MVSVATVGRGERRYLNLVERFNLWEYSASLTDKFHYRSHIGHCRFKTKGLPSHIRSALLCLNIFISENKQTNRLLN